MIHLGDVIYASRLEAITVTLRSTMMRERYSLSHVTLTGTTRFGSTHQLLEMDHSHRYAILDKYIRWQCFISVKHQYPIAEVALPPWKLCFNK
jgi:hypothetical protein